ncbi:MAG: S53 family peptidase [Vulcanimicrobiaceae bacterium]
MELLRLSLGTFVAAVLLTACGGGSQSVSPTAPVPNTPLAIARIPVVVNGTPTIGTPGTYSLSITAESVDGAVITGTYPTPIILSDSDTSGATHLSVTSVPNSATAVSLTYNGLGGSPLGGFQGATITATEGSVSGQVTLLSNGSVCSTFKNIGGYYPCDLQNAYSLPSMTAGYGQTVAIVDAYDDPNAEADLGVYRSEFGLPPCTTANGCFEKVNQKGVQGSPPPADTTGWSAEESLDLDMVSAICPNCHIILVEANSPSFSDLDTAEDEAATLGATEISNSWAAAEFSGQTALDASFNHPGIMITVAAGDSDYGAVWPATSPYVTAVGGTNLTVASNGRGWNEVVWNNAEQQGTGSGCSAYEPKPAWQTDTGCPNRMEADVAAVADPYTGVAVYDTYLFNGGPNSAGWNVYGGTSVATPIIAGVYALGGNGASLTYGSSSYGNPSALNNVTSGNNELYGGSCSPAYFCTAGVGYNGPTGNGTPLGTGAFGGPALVSAQSAQPVGHRVWRHVLLPAAGTPISRVCPKALPGFARCDAILVNH